MGVRISNTVASSIEMYQSVFLFVVLKNDNNFLLSLITLVLVFM